MSVATKIAVGLAGPETLDHAGLAERWRSLMRRPPPKAASRVFLLRALSYELQAKHAPGLSKADQKTLDRSVRPETSRSSKSLTAQDAMDPMPNRPPLKPRTVLVPGSRLVREWNGQAYTVSVIEEGFVYKDKVWSSLSAIAKDITGAHWSGPRFFGLNKASA